MSWASSRPAPDVAKPRGGAEGGRPELIRQSGADQAPKAARRYRRGRCAARRCARCRQHARLGGFRGSTAATNWFLLGGAAEQAGRLETSSLAYVRSGTLFLEARTATRAEAALEKA